MSPIKYSLYPKNWKTEIRPAILKRAKNCCENCGVPNYAVGHRNNGVFIPTVGNFYHDKAGRGELTYKQARKLVQHCNEWCGDNLIVIVLTISHQDHDVNNNKHSNLKALCQKCHLDHDKEFHIRNRKYKKDQEKRIGQLF